MHVKVGAHVIVMAQVLGLLWMCNPLRVVYAKEGKALLPGSATLKASCQPACTKKGLPAVSCLGLPVAAVLTLYMHRTTCGGNVC